MSETRTASPEQIRKMTAAEFATYKKKMGMPDAVTKRHLAGKSSAMNNIPEYNYGGNKVKMSQYYSGGGTVYTGR